MPKRKGKLRKDEYIDHDLIKTGERRIRRKKDSDLI